MRSRSIAIGLVPFLFTVACTRTNAVAGSDTTAAATSASAASTTTDRAAARKYIEDADAKWAAAENSGDAKTIAAMFADSGVGLYAGRPTLHGRDAIAKSSSDEFAKTKVSNTVFHTDDVLVSGDLAVETGTYSEMRTPKRGGKATAARGRYLTVWQKQSDGTWKVVRDVDTSAEPASKAATTS
ncbi:MAG TPA: SgcJ/EcaC family oxidoreductase [Candidatus Elarobacter sp.]|nr:SgcJ/EcaC family oxidoreductase [Candidatus Elarobacter sp.]